MTVISACPLPKRLPESSAAQCHQSERLTSIIVMDAGCTLDIVNNYNRPVMGRNLLQLSISVYNGADIPVFGKMLEHLPLQRGCDHRHFLEFEKFRFGDDGELP